MKQPSYNESWYQELLEQVPNTGTDTFKTILDQTAKLLDHLNVNSEAISQKARWGIGIIVALLATTLTVLGNGILNGKLPVPTAATFLPFLPAWLLVLAAFGFFAYIAFYTRRQHSGIEPRLYFWGSTIDLALDRAREIGEDAPRGMEHAYILLNIIEDYQRRIERSRQVNKRLSKWFNLGAVSLMLGVIGSAVTYLLL